VIDRLLGLLDDKVNDSVTDVEAPAVEVSVGDDDWDRVRDTVTVSVLDLGDESESVKGRDPLNVLVWLLLLLGVGLEVPVLGDDVETVQAKLEVGVLLSLVIECDALSVGTLVGVTDAVA